jgi:hypothetical protein
MYHRLFRPSDFVLCPALLPPGFRVASQVREALPSLWRRLHLHGQLNGGVVIDPQRSGEKAILAFGLSVFVTETFTREYLASPVPYVSALVYERMLQARSPILLPEEVPAANAAGRLNLLILHFGLRVSRADDTQVAAVAAVAQEGFRLCHDGLRVSRVLQEAYGPRDLPYFQACGFLIKSEYEDVFAREGRVPAADERPYLVGLYREDAESRCPGNLLSRLFQHAEPRFGFSAAQQRVLLRALMDAPDEVIADALGVSHDAVKQSWRRIYERAAAAAPELMDDGPEPVGTRGKEKRRHLLQHLRYHLEELRPWP